jgi:hypothetical protein
MGAKNSGRRYDPHGPTRKESAYGNRRRREHAEAAGQSKERRFRTTERVTHFACGVVFRVVVHGAGLPWRDWTIAFLFVGRGRAPQNDRRGGGTGKLADEPATGYP